MTFQVGAPGLQLQRLQVPRNVALSVISQPVRERAETGVTTVVGHAILGISVQAAAAAVVTVTIVPLLVRLLTESVIFDRGRIIMTSRGTRRTDERRW